MTTLVYAEDLEIIDLVGERIKGSLNSSGRMDQILQEVQERPGKMIRPLLVVLSSQICNGSVDDALLDVAAGVELVHMASLVHDDIVDDSPMRRGKLSLNEAYCSSTAVLAGDYLFAAAFQLFTSCGENQVLHTMTNTIRLMCEGEVNQLLDPLCVEEDYWEYIYKKTACLVGASCRVGAVLGLPEEPSYWSRLTVFGECIGYAFQIVDDILDYSSTGTMLGKKVGMDYQEGMWTLPTLRGVQKGVLPVDWRNCLSFQEVSYLLDRAGIITEIYEEAQGQVAKAKSILDEFPETPYLDRLIELCNFVVRRKF